MNADKRDYEGENPLLDHVTADINAVPVNEESKFNGPDKGVLRFFPVLEN
jgi:hypothetical protein